MKKFSNTEAELKNALLIKKSVCHRAIIFTLPSKNKVIMIWILSSNK